jgi:hypothetical protein
VTVELLPKAPEGAGEEPIQRGKFIGMIPPSLMTQSERERMEAYILNELAAAEGERSGFVRKLARWQEAYRAPMPDAPKHFPLFNSSNLVIPVIKEGVNTIAAQIVQATDTARPRWIFKELAKEWEPFSDKIETFLDLASDRDMELSPVLEDWIVDIVKLGTGILEVPWEVDERQIYKYDETGQRAYPSRVVLRDGPSPRFVPLQKFWIRFHERDIQRARWVAKELELNEVELKQRDEKGKLHHVQDILDLDSGKNLGDDVQKVDERVEETTPLSRDHKLFELWMSWDFGNGVFTEIKVYFSRETQKLHGEFFNPYWHAHRPFIKEGFFPQTDRFYDEGLCEMLENLQAAISATVNRRADNESLSNMKMFLKRRTVRNFGPGDPLYLGKIVEVNDPLTDVRELNMSEVHPSTVNEEQILQRRVERVAGTNEGVAGAAMPVTRTTAGAQIALLQEQAKRIDLAIRNVRRGIQKIGWFGMQLYSQHGTNGKAVAWMGDNGKMVEAVFRLPRKAFELGVYLHAQTPTSMANRQIRKENKLAMFNLLLQLHEKLFEIGQAFAPDTLPLVAAGAIKGAQKFMVDIFEAFEEPDPEGVLSSLAVLEKVLPQMESLNGDLGGIERGLEVSQILERISGLERLVSEAETFAEGGGGVSNGSGERTRPVPPQGPVGGNDVGVLFGGQSD